MKTLDVAEPLNVEQKRSTSEEAIPQVPADVDGIQTQNDLHKDVNDENSDTRSSLSCNLFLFPADPEDVATEIAVSTLF